jgi:hypothetical protein
MGGAADSLMDACRKAGKSAEFRALLTAVLHRSNATRIFAEYCF